jgi:hypothetical protein
MKERFIVANNRFNRPLNKRSARYKGRRAMVDGDWVELPPEESSKCDHLPPEVRAEVEVLMAQYKAGRWTTVEGWPRRLEREY